jgi:hypothetical protein
VSARFVSAVKDDAMGEVKMRRKKKKKKIGRVRDCMRLERRDRGVRSARISA